MGRSQPQETNVSATINRQNTRVTDKRKIYGFGKDRRSNYRHEGDENAEDRAKMS